MRKAMLSVICLLCLALPLTAADGNRVERQLDSLFRESEQCYLKDDYQQLEACIEQYNSLFLKYKDKIRDADLFSAYYDKMCGAYCYGFAEDEGWASYAEEFYRSSLSVFEKRVKTKNIKGMHANAVTLHQELAQLYYKAKDYPRAKAQLDTVFTYYKYKLVEASDLYTPTYYLTLSQLAMCNARLGHFETALSQIEESINKYYKKQKTNDYYEALRKKGKILMLQADSLGAADYKKAVDCYRQYVNERYAAIERELSGMNDSQRGQYWLATHQFLYDCCRLGNHAPEMLYDLALFSKDYLVRKNATRSKWEQVRKTLGKRDCAIEFIQYFGRHDERRMGCLVLRHNSKRPVFVDLFSTDSLLDVSVSWYETIGIALTSSESEDKNVLYSYPELPELIWTESLMSAIGDAEKVYFSPDGMLHQLAIEYLMPDTSKTCYRLSSTRHLLQKRTTPKLESALLCGGIVYDTNYQPNNKDNDVIAYRFLSSNISEINYLPGTYEEVSSIYTQRNAPLDTLLDGKTATDESFLRLLKRNYKVIHIATHGFYGDRLGIYSDIKPLSDDKSMSKSGLFFAGSAQTLTNKDFDENMFDGVLSAEELSKQDLSKTELIVLSACQTGLGHLTDDGIYGIQRGLKMAGAHAMILSLWSVNDKATSLLMESFYKHLKTEDVHTAFMNARLDLIHSEFSSTRKLHPSKLTYAPSSVSYNQPQYYNAFILIDAK